MKHAKPTHSSDRRDRERGAALISAVLISMLLLAAGGALLLTTGMAAGNAVDATAEAQAYYAAEAGVQATLNVLRGNHAKDPNLTLPANTYICNNFRVANLLATSNLSTDAANNPDGDTTTNDGFARLSGWLPYSGTALNSRVMIEDNTGTQNDLAFDIRITDPADPNRTQLNAGTSYRPVRLLIQSTGYGPKGAVKRMEVLIDNSGFGFVAHAAIAIRSDDDNLDGMPVFSVGSSQPHSYSGEDQAVPAQPAVPAFAVTNTADYDMGDGFGPLGLQGKGEAAIADDSANISGAAQIAKLDPTTLEDYLRTPQGARNLLNRLEATARIRGRYFNTDSAAGPTTTPDFGSEADPQFTFVNGNADLGGSTVGAGLLVVTGKLTMSGSSTFKGIVLALGAGNVERNGTPGAAGAILLAKFARTGTSTKFEAPSLDTDGGGNSSIRYDSGWVNRALDTFGYIVVGVREY
jgi:hypothetical protein